jgi:cytidine deaminase
MNQVRKNNNRMDQINKLAKEIEKIKHRQKVVLTGGAFDLFHIGHLNYLKSAKKFGDILVVHVDGDVSVATKKGEGRPIITSADRLEIVRGVKYVDHAVSSNKIFYSAAVLRKLQTDVIVKTKRLNVSSAFIQAQEASIKKILPHVKIIYIDETLDISTTKILETVGEPLRLVHAVDKDVLKLHTLAKEVSPNGYSFSGFKVGAAIEMENGEFFTGANIGNSSPSLAMCAERVAIAKAVSAGNRKLRKLCLFSSSKQVVTPCGLCRQTIYEFSDPRVPTEIFIANPESIYTSSIDRLLPRAFVTPRKI